MAELLTRLPPHLRAHEARRYVLTILPGCTYADYAALPEGTRAQLIDGDLVIEGELTSEGTIMSPAPKSSHQRIVSRLDRNMGVFVEEAGLGEVIVSPIDVRLGDRAFQPDLIYVAADRLHVIGEQQVEGAPDLVVEVISPSTGYFDLTVKRAAYEEAGVREYWIVDPEQKTVEVLTLEAGGYRTAARGRGEGRVASVLLAGFEVELAPLFDLGGPRRREG